MTRSRLSPASSLSNEPLYSLRWTVPAKIVLGLLRTKPMQIEPLQRLCFLEHLLSHTATLQCLSYLEHHRLVHEKAGVWSTYPFATDDLLMKRAELCFDDAKKLGIVKPSPGSDRKRPMKTSRASTTRNKFVVRKPREVM